MQSEVPASVAIVIVNWNSGRLLRECLESVRNDASESLVQIIVVDNDSSDSSLTGLPDDSRLSIVRSNENVGFGRACNLGARQSSSEFILFLNPDCTIQTGLIDSISKTLGKESHRRDAVLGIALTDSAGRIQRHCARRPTASTMVFDAVGLSKLFPRLFHGMIMEEFDHLTSRQVDHVIGGFYLVRRKVFDMVGGFDEAFFLFLEDLDLSCRIKDEGWGIWYSAEHSAHHEGGGTTRQIKARRLFYSVESRLLFAKKRLGRVAYTMVVGASLFVEPLSRLLQSLLRLDRGSARETLIAFRMVYRQVLFGQRDFRR